MWHVNPIDTLPIRKVFPKYVQLKLTCTNVCNVLTVVNQILYIWSNFNVRITILGNFIAHVNTASDDLYQKIPRKLNLFLAYIDYFLEHEAGYSNNLFKEMQCIYYTCSNCLQGYGYIRIDGRTPAELRQTYCDQFQHDEKCLLAILSITTANAGN